MQPPSNSSAGGQQNFRCEECGHVSNSKSAYYRHRKSNCQIPRCHRRKTSIASVPEFELPIHGHEQGAPGAAAAAAAAEQRNLARSSTIQAQAVLDSTIVAAAAMSSAAAARGAMDTAAATAAVMEANNDSDMSPQGMVLCSAEDNTDAANMPPPLTDDDSEPVSANALNDGVVKPGNNTSDAGVHHNSPDEFEQLKPRLLAAAADLELVIEDALIDDFIESLRAAAVSEETMGIDEDEDDWLNDADWLLPPMSGALEEDGSQDDDDEAGVRGNSNLAHLRSKLFQPLYEGATITLAQTAFLALHMKRQHNQKDSHFEEECNLQHSVRLPQPNNHPTSLHIIKRLLDCREVHDVEQHVCVNDCCKFNKLQPREYRQHKHQACPTCGEGRFKVKSTSRGDRLVPRKVFYDFGLCDIPQYKFFADPNWCELRGKGRDTPDDYYSSRAAATLHQRANADITDPDTSVWALGLDFCQWFKSKVHSTGFITLRCEDLPHAQRSKLRYSQILVIIPGPAEPKHLEPYLEDTLAAFTSCAPLSGGLQVTEHKLVDGQLQQVRQFCHKMLLGAVYGDSPGVKKLAKWLSHSAYLGCGYCLLMGVYAHRAMRFLGYLQPTHTAMGSDTAYCGDAAVHDLDHDKQLARAELVAHGVLPKDVGCHGLSCVIEQLSYSDAQDTFVAGVPHAGVYGVVKDFFNHILKPVSGSVSHAYALSNEARRVIENRASHVVPTCDFGRTYTDIIKKRGNWTMEDWLHWTETWSVYILKPHNGQPLLHPVAAEMWQQLRAGILYFSRVHPLPCCAQTAQHAQDALKSYAKLVEEHFGPQMCKFNLHLMVCRLLWQELARGRAAFSNEYWVENLIQWAKSIVKGRTTKYPELVLLMDMLIDEALSRFRCQHPGDMKTYEEWCPPTVGFIGSNLDVMSVDGSQLLGSGRALRQSETELLSAGCAARFNEGLFIPAWQTGDLQNASNLLYTHAQVLGQHVHSSTYLRARSRQSYHVSVSLIRDGQPVTYMARVLFFVKMCAANRPDLRLAVCELHSIVQEPGVAGRLWHVKAYTRPQYSSYVVPISSQEIGEKHVSCTSRVGDHDAWFMPYRNMSGA